MSYNKAVLEVLEHHSSGNPMHYRDIARKAFVLGFVSSHSKTTETNTNVALNKSSLFSPVGGGYYALSKWHGVGPLAGSASFKADDDGACFRRARAADVLQAPARRRARWLS